jgi:hypothetical protein
VKKVYQLLVAMVFILAAAGGGYERVSFATTQEYRVKAAFLMNFAKFVDWPPAAFSDDHAPFVLGIVGDDPSGGAIEALNGQVVKNRTIKVQRLSGTDGLQLCHMLYIGPSESAHLREVARAIGTAPVLTVSDGVEQFAQQGMVINFLLIDNKIRFEINVAIAKKANLSMAAQLLQVGKVVDSEQ